MLVRIPGGPLLLAGMISATVSTPHCIWTLWTKSANILQAFEVKIVTLCLLPLCARLCLQNRFSRWTAACESLIGGVTDTSAVFYLLPGASNRVQLSPPLPWEKVVELKGPGSYSASGHSRRPDVH